ncbi:MAG: caspase family protein [Geminicoccaceae bacterium]
MIGNGSYETIPTLDNPRRDATLIAEKLSTVGFDVDLVLDSDYLSLMQRVRSFGYRAHGADAALFYYAGHGIQADGSNYLLPVDADLGRIADLPYQTLPLSLVMGELEFADARINLVVLDACRDNPLTRSLKGSSGTRNVSISEGLASIKRASGTFIAYATAPGEVAYDGHGTQNSPFTRALADWIEKPDLEIALMFRRVREQVVAATNGKQVPWVEEAILGDFYFRPKGTTVAIPAALPAKVEREENVQPLSSLPPQNDVIVSAWSTARTLGTHEAYKDFLERYPDSIFAHQAMALMSRLAASSAPASSEASLPEPAHSNHQPTQPNSGTDATIKIIQGSDAIPNLY